MRVSDFNFALPEELIAQSPPAIRGSSRMLVVDRATGAYQDNFFRNLPEILRPGDLLILNDSRVIPARLYATRAGLHTQHNSPDPTGRIEVLLTQQLGADDWTALVRPSRKVQPGEHLLFHAPNETKPLLEAEILASGEFGEIESARAKAALALAQSRRCRKMLPSSIESSDIIGATSSPRLSASIASPWRPIANNSAPRSRTRS